MSISYFYTYKSVIGIKYLPNLILLLKFYWQNSKFLWLNRKIHPHGACVRSFLSQASQRQKHSTQNLLYFSVFLALVCRDIGDGGHVCSGWYANKTFVVVAVYCRALQYKPVCPFIYSSEHKKASFAGCEHYPILLPLAALLISRLRSLHTDEYYCNNGHGTVQIFKIIERNLITSFHKSKASPSQSHLPLYGLTKIRKAIWKQLKLNLYARSLQKSFGCFWKDFSIIHYRWRKIWLLICMTYDLSSDKRFAECVDILKIRNRLKFCVSTIPISAWEEWYLSKVQNRTFSDYEYYFSRTKIWLNYV